MNTYNDKETKLMFSFFQHNFAVVLVLIDHLDGQTRPKPLQVMIQPMVRVTDRRNKKGFPQGQWRTCSELKTPKHTFSALYKPDSVTACVTRFNFHRTKPVTHRTLNSCEIATVDTLICHQFLIQNDEKLNSARQIYNC